MYIRYSINILYLTQISEICIDFFQSALLQNNIKIIKLYFIFLTPLFLKFNANKKQFNFRLRAF